MSVEHDDGCVVCDTRGDVLCWLTLLLFIVVDVAPSLRVLIHGLMRRG